MTYVTVLLHGELLNLQGSSSMIQGGDSCMIQRLKKKTHWTLICMQAKTQNVWISKLSVNKYMTCDYDWFFRMSVIAVLWMNAFFHPFYRTSRSKHKRVKLRREDYAHKKAGSKHMLSRPGFFFHSFSPENYKCLFRDIAKSEYNAFCQEKCVIIFKIV